MQVMILQLRLVGHWYSKCVRSIIREKLNESMYQVSTCLLKPAGSRVENTCIIQNLLGAIMV